MEKNKRLTEYLEFAAVLKNLEPNVPISLLNLFYLPPYKPSRYLLCHLI